MQNLTNLFTSLDKEVLLIGKGPTFNLKDKILLSKYFTICLNHSIRETKCNAVSIIDVDVIRECEEDIYNNSDVLIVPWRLHDKDNNYLPGKKTLLDYAKEIPRLNDLIHEDRVYCYNASSSTIHKLDNNSAFDEYPVYINNGDSMYSALLLNDIKNVYSIGMDGGKTYSSTFSDLTPMENGQSFDRSINQIQQLDDHFNNKFVRINDLPEIKVYVGCSEAEYVPCKVLEYSIKKHTNNPVSVVPLYQCDTAHRMPVKPECRPRTPFSFQRFFIPSLTSGKAFYFDSDMLVLKDMNELLNYDFDGYDIISCKDMDVYSHWKGSEYAVLMLNCDNIEWNIDSIIDDLDNGKLTYDSLMFDFAMADVKSDFPPEWNSLDHYEENKTANLHYTDMGTQPWRSDRSPYKDLWFKYLKETVKSGILTKETVIEHGKLGYIRRFA